ncbi:MAG: AMP-binding protein, partial [Rhodococcus sp. (in: high G+C Gram-positive bacteria)]|uniref:AMP-binding protein n=1 Tax=Rhodococcus sp. TaxID=1831 RepID=UPI003D9BCCC6
GHPSLRDLLAERAVAPGVSFDPATHLAVLPYSSGTTGRPKGVMLTHRNLVANVCQINPRMGIGPQDRVLAVLPFFHIYGMTVLLNAALSNRAALVTMPKFDLVEFLGLIAERKCTYVFIAPPVAVALAKHPLVDQYDLSSIHTVFSGAAPLDKALGGAVAARLGCNVRQGYGMSEMSPVSHAIPFSDNETELDSVGPAVANMECKIVDPVTGEEVEYPTGEGVSEPGELWCKGPNIMAGYLKNDEATAETLDADGYLHTGDIATVDAQGAVRIVDRLKELIKYKGYQVPPAELEALLLTHPQIADAAVIGVTDDEGEEIPKAFVVRQPDSSLTEQDVIEFVAERVSPHKKVRQVQFIDVVPKSAAGKILRKDLRVPSA